MKFTFGIITKSENNFGVDDPASTDKKNIVSAIESINNLNIPAEISPLIVKIFNEGKKKYGERALSTSIVKLLEEKCNTNLRSKGFPSQLHDNELRKKGIEIK